jgi:hypothetical protein
MIDLEKTQKWTREDFDLIVSYSMLRTWRVCRGQWHYRYVDRIEPRRKDIRLVKGDIIAQCLEAYSRGDDWKKVIAEYQVKYAKMFEEEQEYYGNVVSDCKKIVNRYGRRYEEEEFEYLFVEQEFGPVPFCGVYNIDGPKIGIVIKPDAVIRTLSDGKIWVLERKTQAKFADMGWRLYDMQTCLYIWVLQKLGLKIHGILWDEIRTKNAAIPQVLKSGELSRRKNIDTDWPTYLRAIRKQGLDPKDYRDMKAHLKHNDESFFRRQYFNIKPALVSNITKDSQKTARDLFRNRDKNILELGFMCRLCDFSSICKAKLTGVDYKFIMKSDFRRRRRGPRRQETQEEARSQA